MHDIVLKSGLKATLAAAALAIAAGASAQAAPPAVPGDAAIGAKLYMQCRACHTTESGGKHLVGPNLAGVMGSKAGVRPGYQFSPALAKSGLSWDAATMDLWLRRPSAVVPGTKMVFAGMANPKARADMIAYLQTLKP